MRLSTYATALSDLLCRADELSVSSEDLQAIAIILASISESFFPQSAPTTIHTVGQHRLLALSALGLEKHAVHLSVHLVPVQGPYLSSKFMEAVDEELDLLSIHTSTYLFLCYFPNIAPKSSKKPVFHSKLTICCHDVTSRDRLDAIFIPFARFPRAGCLSTFTAKIPFFRGFRGPIQEYSYPFSMVLLLYFVLNVFCIAVCFREGEICVFSDTVRIQFGLPAQCSRPNAHFSSPDPLRASSARATARVLHAP